MQEAIHIYAKVKTSQFEDTGGIVSLGLGIIKYWASLSSGDHSLVGGG